MAMAQIRLYLDRTAHALDDAGKQFPGLAADSKHRISRPRLYHEKLGCYRGRSRAKPVYVRYRYMRFPRSPDGARSEEEILRDQGIRYDLPGARLPGASRDREGGE